MLRSEQSFQNTFIKTRVHEPVPGQKDRMDYSRNPL